MTKTTYRATLDDLMDAAVREGVTDFSELNSTMQRQMTALHLLDQYEQGRKELAVEYITNNEHLEECAQLLLQWTLEWPNDDMLKVAGGVLYDKLNEYVPHKMAQMMDMRRAFMREEAREAAMDARREQNLIEGVNSYDAC